MSVNLITPPAYDARFERSRAEWPKRYHPLSRRRQASACFRVAFSLTRSNVADCGTKRQMPGRPRLDSPALLSYSLPKGPEVSGSVLTMASVTSMRWSFS